MKGDSMRLLPTGDLDSLSTGGGEKETGKTYSLDTARRGGEEKKKGERARSREPQTTNVCPDERRKVWGILQYCSAVRRGGGEKDGGIGRSVSDSSPILIYVLERKREGLGDSENFFLTPTQTGEERKRKVEKTPDQRFGTNTSGTEFNVTKMAGRRRKAKHDSVA